MYVCPRTLGQRRKRNNWSTELKFGTRVPYGNTQGCFFHFFKFPFFSRVIPILPGFLAHLTSFKPKKWRQIFLKLQNVNIFFANNWRQIFFQFFFCNFRDFIPNPAGFEQFSERCRRTLVNVSKDLIRRTIDSMQKRLDDIITRNGQRTKYWLLRYKIWYSICFLLFTEDLPKCYDHFTSMLRAFHT